MDSKEQFQQFFSSALQVYMGPLVRPRVGFYCRKKTLSTEKKHVHKNRTNDLRNQLILSSIPHLLTLTL